MDAKPDKWPAFNVERRAVSALKPYKNNARTHSEEQVAQIAASIKEWGWTQPILVDEKSQVIAGHGRLLAAQSLGAVEVPVIIARGWSKAQKRAYVLADNQLASNAGWDEGLLRIELGALGEMSFDTSLLGFGDEFLANLFADKTEGLSDPDDVPEQPDNPVSINGDLWLCGSHSILCGDSTSAEDVARLSAGRLADLCFTSPPYAQQRDYDKGGIGDWDTLMNGVFGNVPLSPSGQILVNLGLVHRDGEWLPYWECWIEWMRAQGWRRFGWYVWDQGPGLAGDWNGRLAPSHEFIFHFNKNAERARKNKAKKPENVRIKGGTGIRRSDGSMSGVSSPEAGLQSNKIADSVIRVMRHKGKSAGGHPAVFSAGLAVEIIQAFSNPGAAIYEPFCGSGTTMIAAEMEGRHAYCMEISEAYCDVIVKRWQDFTGKEATLEGDGRTFEQVSHARS